MTRQETTEKWTQVCKEWQKSTLSQREYCDKIGIKLGTFKYHLNQMRETNNVRRFLPVTLTPEKNNQLKSRPYCTIEFSEKGRIIIESEQGLSELKALINGTK